MFALLCPPRSYEGLQFVSLAPFLPDANKIALKFPPQSILLMKIRTRKRTTDFSLSFSPKSHLLSHEFALPFLYKRESVRKREPQLRKRPYKNGLWARSLGIFLIEDCPGKALLGVGGCHPWTDGLGCCKKAGYERSNSK